MAQRVRHSSDKPPPPDRLIHNVEFLKHLGLFHSVWGTFDLTVDFAIGRLLGLSNRATHLLVVGMEFGRKAQLLQALAKNSRHPGAKQIAAALSKIQKGAKRNIFAHSFIASGHESVTFVYRERDKPTEAKEYEATGLEFQRHVYMFIKAAQEFSAALGASNTDFRRFVAASLKAKKTAETSRREPIWMM